MICFSCPVRRECDAWKEHTHSKYGIWAGKLIKRGE